MMNVSKLTGGRMERKALLARLRPRELTMYVGSQADNEKIPHPAGWGPKQDIGMYGE
jgi:hypothetical protein